MQRKLVNGKPETILSKTEIAALDKARAVAKDMIALAQGDQKAAAVAIAINAIIGESGDATETEGEHEASE